jgi:hypothetical protein
MKKIALTVMLIPLAFIGCETHHPVVESFAAEQSVPLRQAEVMAINPDIQALFDPMPLRVGTEGALVYHHPFCPYAQRALTTHGPSKRVNYFSRLDIPYNREPCNFCKADVWNWPFWLTPEEVIDHGLEYYPFARRTHTVPVVPPDTVICSWTGYVAFAVPPENCVDGGVHTTEGTPITIQCLILNMIPSGIGDANQDGDVDEEDFPYLVAAYSGPDVTATPVAQRLFDYDEDQDVDMSDFQAWFAELGTGNSSWIAANYPDAVEGRREYYPLRVGIQGSDKYHQPDCPAVKRSWETHGYEKAVAWWNWADIEDTGRTPDTVGPPNGCDATQEAEWPLPGLFMN